MSCPSMAGGKAIYWHRDLPPLEALPMGEHTVEANSGRVPGAAATRNDLWQRCERGLAAEVELRLSQEVQRLGGRFAHVLDEHIEAKRDPARDEAWLHGRYTYVLYG